MVAAYHQAGHLLICQPFNLKIVLSELLIKISCVGICGSDVKLYLTGRCGLEALLHPMVMGHEGAGVVAQVGSKVKGFVVGDRVAIEPTQPCGACLHCKHGAYNLCVEPRYCATATGHGNICTYYKHRADFCHKLPANLSMEEGAAVQPLAIAVHACKRARISLGTRLVILGAGPVGVLCMITARAMGATHILLTDVVESRLETAKKMGADHTLLIKPEYSEQDVVDKILTAVGDAPDVSIDACGYPSAQAVAMRATQAGGTVVIVGIGPDRAEVPLAAAMLREVDVRGSYRIANTYPAALAAVSRGAVNLAPFITHHFPFERVKEAMEVAKSGAAMKIIIHMKS
ncbi:hypothetical protein evm_006003 [Chilo suppressalis]|nr:hypothetical protein evm_006003 [Chilo suppressalis]